MSTSIAALPAYRSSKATRTKARAGRTIFGTTLDNSTKASRVFQNESAQSAAQHLFEDRHKKWKTPTSSRQALIHGAWGIKNYSQPEIGEEYSRGYSRASSRSTYSCSGEHILAAADQDIDESLIGTERSVKPGTPLIAFKDRYGVYNVLKENISVQELTKFPGKFNKAEEKPPHRSRSKTHPSSERRRRVSGMSGYASTPAGAKQAKWSGSRKSAGNGVKVPKFPSLPGERNYMRTASLKITETGAKDLINAESINKIGLGDTLQYNHQAFQKRETPNQYRDHGNVFSLGQRGNTTTTNREVTGPGRFYMMSTPDRMLNEGHSDKSDGASVYSLPYEPYVSSRRTYDAVKKKRTPQKLSETAAELDNEIPLNIIHKYGADDVRNLLSGSEHQVKHALQEAKRSSLTHSGMVPPRIDVPELNQPIDPPPTYYSNFGQSLKYDKFDGLHLYIH